MRSIGLILTGVIIIGILVFLAGCASDGSIATGDRPLDKERTRLALCEGAQKLDIAFQVIHQASPELIPEHVVLGEAAFIRTVGFEPGSPATASPGSVCAKEYSGDLDVAINTAILATVNISKLIQAVK